MLDNIQIAVLVGIIMAVLIYVYLQNDAEGGSEEENKPKEKDFYKSVMFSAGGGLATAAALYWVMTRTGNQCRVIDFNPLSVNSQNPMIGPKILIPTKAIKLSDTSSSFGNPRFAPKGSMKSPPNDVLIDLANFA